MFDFWQKDLTKTEFYENLQKAYKNTANYSQLKFPLKNELLKLLPSIDPKCQGNLIAALMMKKLKGYFLNIIKDDEFFDAFNIEVNNYHLINNLPPVSQSDDVEKSLGMCWAETLVNHQYPNLFNLIKAFLSIFTGPIIEQSFRYALSLFIIYLALNKMQYGKN